MVAKSDSITLHCNFHTYEAIICAVVAAARRAHAADDTDELNRLSSVMFALCCAEGLTAQHLAGLSLWLAD
jgi:hypothetical protein